MSTASTLDQTGSVMDTPRRPVSRGRLARQFVFCAAASGLLFVPIACSTSDTPDLTINVDPAAEPGGRSCLTRDIDGDPAGEACVISNVTGVTIDASGLREGSTLTVEGSDGNTVSFDVDAGLTVLVDVGAQIVESAFDVRGTWSDGASWTINYAG